MGHRTRSRGVLFASAVLAFTDVAAASDSTAHPRTLEDIYGDTGNRFRGAIGIVTFEGNTTAATRSYGVGIDDMYVEWKEFTLDPDVTSCATGNCAVLELSSTNLFQATTVLGVSLLENHPYSAVCTGGTNDGRVCFTADPDCPLGSCTPAASLPGGPRNDCDLDGTFDDAGDDDDCNDNGVEDVVARATSESDLAGVILVLDRQGSTSEYRGELTVSLSFKSPGVLFLAQNGTDSPTITVTYEDLDDGTGHPCQNSVLPEEQGLVRAVTTAFIPDCDLALAGVSFTDNGDGDLFADSDETLAVSFSVRNNCGVELTGCSARLVTASPWVECVQRGVVPLGTIPSDAQGPPITAAQPFVFKVGAGADRATLGLDPSDPFAASFTVAFTCNEIDANTFPQVFTLPLDLNLSDLGQPSQEWTEGFETATLGKFVPENLDAGMPGLDNLEGLVNGNGWRCQYSNPDWVNGSAYGSDYALDCFPAMNMAHADEVFWRVDGATALHDGPKKAFRGAHSMYYGVWLYGALAGEFTTPLATVESVRTTDPINLGVGDPKLSFWHMISLVDHRTVGSGFKRSADRGVLQIQLAGSRGAPTSVWQALNPSQNGYDQQAGDNFFNCMFDPIDDGNDEDDFFDPTDPARSLGPSSTCFPAFSYAWMGNTADPFNPADIGWAQTPPAASDSPDLGPGTWVQSIVDLSEFRGRRARLRFLVASIKPPQGETAEESIGINPAPNDDGWWIDDVAIDDTLAQQPAEFVNDVFVLGTCSASGEACIGQCRASFAPCSPTVPCGVGAGDCVLPCPTGQTCSGPPPSCGATCTAVTAHVVAETESESLLDPASIATPAPGQVVSLNAADPADPSTADACLSGTLQFRFCISGDVDGGGPGEPDDDCADGGLDTILRSWTENPTYTDAPQASGSYVVEVRCSTSPTCSAARRIEVEVGCPGGANALGLADVRAASKVLLTWSGDPLAVDTWTSVALSTSAQFSTPAPYPGTTTNSVALVTSMGMPESPAPGRFHAYLVKADGPTNHVSPGVLRCSDTDVSCAIDTDCPGFASGEQCLPLQIDGYYCNSRSWRSGGLAEIPEHSADPGAPSARDETLGDP